MAGEGEGGGFQVELKGFIRDIWGGDCEEDVVALGIGLGRALGPDDYVESEGQ